ncbi:FHIPEP family type III secretion protein, partial [Aliarcobacter butzleri]
TLLDHVRAQLYRLITLKFIDTDGFLHIITIKPDVEHQFIGKLQEHHGISQSMLSIAVIHNLVTTTKQLLDHVAMKGFS